MATRYQDPRIYFLGTIPTVLDKKIPTGKLPTYSQVLLSYIAHKELLQIGQRICDNVTRDASKETTDMILIIYESASIPTIKHHKMCEKIEKHHNVMQNLMKIPAHRRENNRKIKEFKDQLGTTFPFWPKNVFDQIHEEEDKNFLQSMMTDRQVVISGVGKEITPIDEYLDSSSQDEMSDDEYKPNIPIQPKRSHKRKVKTGITISIPPDILKSNALCSTAIRNNITPTKLASVIHTFVSSCNEDPTKLYLHPSQAYRYPQFLSLL